MSRTVTLVLALVLALVLSAVGPADAMYEKNSPVVSLTPDSFQELVLESNHVWLVEFYAPWCGHCQRLKPEYEKAAGNLKGLVKVGAVDCDADKNKPLCGQYGIQGFPTIKVFPSEFKPMRKGSDKMTKQAIDYNGERSARAMVDFGVAQLTSHVRKIASKQSKTSMTLEDFLGEQSDKLSHAILFTAKTTTTPLFKALSIEFKDRLILGEVLSTDAALVSQFNIDKFPTLIVLPMGSPNEPVVYGGALKSEDLMKFLETYALPISKKPSEPQKPAQPAEEPFDPEVHEVKTQADLEKHCVNKPFGTCLITFAYVDPEFEETVEAHEQTLAILRNLKKKAHDKKQAFHIFWVNAIKQKELREGFNVSDMFPSVVAVTPARKVYRPFVGGFEEESLELFMTDYTTGKGGRSFKYTHEMMMK